MPELHRPNPSGCASAAWTPVPEPFEPEVAVLARTDHGPGTPAGTGRLRGRLDATDALELFQEEALPLERDREPLPHDPTPSQAYRRR